MFEAVTQRGDLGATQFVGHLPERGSCRRDGTVTDGVESGLDTREGAGTDVCGDRVDVEVGIARRIRLVCIGFEQPRGMRTERAVDEEIPAESVCSGFVEERASILFAVYTLTPVAPNLPRRDRGPNSSWKSVNPEMSGPPHS